MKLSGFYWLFALCVLASRLVAQSGSFGTLPLLKKENAAKLLGQKIRSGEKFQRALRLYNILVNARGDRRYPVPELVMENTVHQVASINYDDLQIVLEEKAYDVCDAFGPDGDAALATLLAHELSHYYEKHAWRRGFVANFQDLDIAFHLDSLQDDAVHETQADYIGGFLTFSAGFGRFAKGAALIDSLYRAYGISEQIPGYPSLSDRKALSMRTSDRLGRLIDVFEMANLLTAAGKYDEAYVYYKFVLQEYQSREIYNNVGTTALLQAIAMQKPGEQPYHLPLELDLESALSRGEDTTGLPKHLLLEAIRHFDAAISLDPDYATAYLNKACAYLLLGDEPRALFYAGTEARQAAQRSNAVKVEADIEILLGILAARRGDQASAQGFFEAAIQKGSTLAAINLDILHKKPVLAFANARGSGLPERLDGQSIHQIAESPQYEDTLSVRLQKNLYLHQNEYENSRVFISFHEDLYTYSVFATTKPGYAGKTARDLAIGATSADIEAAYGTPKSSIQTPRGQLLVYPEIMFETGQNDQLVRWILYLPEYP